MLQLLDQELEHFRLALFAVQRYCQVEEADRDCLDYAVALVQRRERDRFLGKVGLIAFVEPPLI